MKNNWIKIIVVGFIAIIGIISIIKNKGDNLEMFKNTNISDSAKIEKILNLLDYGKDGYTYDLDDNILNVNYSAELFDYKTLEKNASIMFYLVNDLDTINYQINNDKYSFTYDKVSLIYDGYNDADIKMINDRYKEKHFSNLYLGNINGRVDIFDTSDLCLDNYWEILTTDQFVYYITCSEVDSVIVVSDGIEYTLVESLEKNIIDIDDLFETNLKINRRRIDNENIS